MAVMAPQVLRTAAITTTIVVVPAAVTIEPTQRLSTNCARKTMLETMATSVPSPRTWCVVRTEPSAPDGAEN